MTTSAVAICNLALAHIGSEARVTAIDPPDGSLEASWCEIFYPLARTDTLWFANWPFARKRVDLAELTNDSDVWGFKYQLPSDCLRALMVIAGGEEDERYGAEFIREGSAIYANEEDAVLIYVQDVTDTSTFPVGFQSALSFTLASYLCGPIIKGAEGMKIGDAMRERAIAYAGRAAAMDANSSQFSAGFTPGPIQARA